MHIYVDFDDCLCETARSFSGLAMEMFGKDVPYEGIRFFELDKSFERLPGLPPSSMNGYHAVMMCQS